MSIKKNWQDIKAVIESGQASSVHCSIATVTPEGAPHVTPIGSVFLRDDQTGFFFDHYAKTLGQNIDNNPNVCIMAINSGVWFWLRTLFTGRFASYPGVRLHGQAGPVREATQAEIQQIEKRVKPFMLLKGSRQLWSDFTHVRDIEFTGYKPVTYPIMMEGLWK